MKFVNILIIFILILFFTLIGFNCYTDNKVSIGGEANFKLINIELFNEEPNYKNLTPTELITETQRGLDRTINMLEIILGAIALLLAVAGIIGIPEISKIKDSSAKIHDLSLQFEREKTKLISDVETLNKYINDIKEITPIVEAIHVQTSLVYDYIDNIVISDLIPSEASLKQLKDNVRKLDLLEVLGFQLNAKAFITRGLGYYYDHSYDKAIETWEKALNLDPNLPDVWDKIGMSWIKIGNNDIAKHSFQKAIDLNPNHERAWDNLGSVLVKLKDYNGAIEAHLKAIEINPKSASAYDNLGYAYYCNNDNESAIKYFEKAISLKPNFAKSLDNIGRCYAKISEWEKAINYYRKSLSAKPNFAIAWDNLGFALFKLGQYEDAITAHEKAIINKTDFYRAWDNKGSALIKLGRYYEALFAFERAIEINPDFSIAWYNKACLLTLMGNREEARYVLSRAINLNAKCLEYAKEEPCFKDDYFYDILNS